jgi:protein-S-isoprenylcysteine O-methyltransferase Ste14
MQRPVQESAGLSDKEEQQMGMAHIPPPLTYLAFLAVGLVANIYYPLPISSSGTILLLILGFGVVTSGLAVGAVGLRAMQRAGVSPLPWRAPGKLVVDGPFRYSRNPLYVSLTLMYVGISVAINTLWPPALLFFAIVIVDRGVILQEEKFLERKFGEEYLSYKARVRRWI